MATVTGLTAQRMLQIERASIVNGRVDGDELILRTQGGDEIVAGKVRGPEGFAGPTGTSFWVTDTPLTEGFTSQVNPRPIPGQTVRVGDTIMSTDPDTVGSFGTVTQVTSQTNVTVEFLSSLRGPAGEGDGPTQGPAVPGTMVWRADYNPNVTYTYGDVVRTTSGLFVALETVQNQAPALPMDPFADTFDGDAISSEWQINNGWLASGGRARYSASSSLARLVKTNLTPDGTFRVDGFSRYTLNDAGYIYFGWVDDLNHYRFLFGGVANTTLYLQKVVSGAVTNLASDPNYFGSTAPPIVITKKGGNLEVRAESRVITAVDPNPLNGTGWGFGYDAYNTSEATVTSVLFTPSESMSWGVIERRWALDSLTNVQVPTPNDGDFLSYDESTGTWLSKPIIFPDDNGEVHWDEIIGKPNLDGGGGGGTLTFPFGGALICPEATQNYSASGVVEPIRFSKVIYDTAGFWSNQAPNTFIVPEGVTKVRLVANVHVDSSDQIPAANWFFFRVNEVAVPGLSSGSVPTGGYSNPALNLASSVISVTAGDRLDLVAQATQTFSLGVSANKTFFSVEVVERNGSNVGINYNVQDLLDVQMTTPPADGEVLIWNSTLNKWEAGLPVVVTPTQTNRAFRGAMCSLTATRSFANVIFPVPWDTTLYDTDAFWSIASPGRFVIPQGVTKVRLSAAMSPDGSVLGSNNDTLGFRKNGERFPGEAVSGRELGYADVGLSITSPVIPVVPGDFFEVRYSNSTTGNKAWSVHSYFSIEVVEALEAI